MIAIETEYPLALDSNDHLHPWGAYRDDTTCPAFLKACERLRSARPLHYLDLGCAGGGLVREFLNAGHYAIGIDGSDTPRKLNRWAQYPENFITADISRTFWLRTDKVLFDFISAWEVLEHIPEERLPVLFANIRNHLKSDGLFVGSVSMRPDVVEGIPYHVTVHDENWWRKQFVMNGLVPILSPFKEEEYARRDPCSFHIVAQPMIDIWPS